MKKSNNNFTNYTHSDMSSELDEMEQLLRHYRTIDDQLKLLELSHNIEELRDEGDI